MTKIDLLNYFASELDKNARSYDDCGDINATMLAENAQDHFNCMTELGDSEIEQFIFDTATEYCSMFKIIDFI